MSAALWLFITLGVSNQSSKGCYTSHPADGVLGIRGRHSNDDYNCVIIPQAIQKEASELLKQQAVQIQTWTHFIGNLVATKPAVPLGLLHFQALQDLKIQALHHGPTTYQL